MNSIERLQAAYLMLKSAARGDVAQRFISELSSGIPVQNVSQEVVNLLHQRPRFHFAGGSALRLRNAPEMHDSNGWQRQRASIAKWLREVRSEVPFQERQRKSYIPDAGERKGLQIQHYKNMARLNRRTPHGLIFDMAETQDPRLSPTLSFNDFSRPPAHR